MSAREVAMEFLRCFCAGDIEGLAPLLASELEFKGPFHQFSSSESILHACEVTRQRSAASA